MTRKNKKIILSIVGLLLLIIVAGFIYLHQKLPAMLTQRFEKQLDEQLNPGSYRLYDIEIEQVQINSIFSKILFPHISIRPQDQVYEVTETDTLPSRLFHLEIRDFNLSSDGIIDFVLKRDKISFNHLNLPRVMATVLENPDGKEDRKSGDDESESPQNAAIKNLKVHLVSVRQKLFSDTTNQLLKANDIELSGAISYQKNKRDSVPVILLENYNLQTEAIAFFPQDQLYSYHCDSIRLESSDSIVNLFSLRLSPLYDKKEFQKYLTYQTDRMEVDLEHASFEGFDPNELINKKQLSLSQIKLNTGRIGVHRDRNLPFDTLRRPAMPYGLIRNAPLHLSLSRTEMQDIDLYYSELPENGDKEGVVPIENIKAKINNITNIDSLLQQDSIMQIKASATMFDEARLAADFDYNLTDRNGGFQASGELSRLEFRTLNPVLMPLVDVKVKEGVHEKSNFSFSGNDVRSTGELKMYYKDLNITLEPDRSELRKNIVNWAGRNLLYHPSNPQENEELRTGTIDFERDVTRFVFHYWWKSYLSGIENTVVRDYVDL